MDGLRKLLLSKEDGDEVELLLGERGRSVCVANARLAVWESRNLWRLSWATAAIAAFTCTLNLVTQVFVGHLGTLELAGVSVVNIGVQGVAYGILMGMVTALQTVCGQAFGAHKYSMMGTVCQKAVLLNLAAAVPFSVFYFFSGALLLAVGQSAEISAIGQTYARASIPQLIAYAIYLPVQRFLQSQNIVNPVAYLAAAVLLLHVVISWVMMRVLGLGIVGAGLSLSFSWCLLAGGTCAYVAWSPSCRRTWTGLSRRAFSGLWPYLKLTVASAIMLCLEIWYNQGMVFLSALLPNPEIALDSISICSNYLLWDSTFMFGLGGATSVRISNELGADRPAVAKLAIVVAVTTGLLIGLILGSIVLVFRVALTQLYTNSDDLLAAATGMMPLLALSMLLNGIQPIFSGVAIGSGWQGVVAYVNLGAYYLIGLPVGCVLGFRTSLRVAGIWWGLILGVLVQTVTLVVMTTRTNWNKEVERAKERIRKNEDGEVLASVGCE